MLSTHSSCVAKEAMPCLFHKAAQFAIKRGNTLSLAGTESGFTGLEQIEHYLKVAFVCW